jgi:hypothetical protein
MSKMKSKAASMHAPEAEPREGGIEREPFDDAEFQNVDLLRTWYQPAAGQRPIFLLPLARSENVRSIFPSKFPGQSNRPAHVWACELWLSTKETDLSTYRGQRPCAAEAGTVVYVFEHSLLVAAFHRAWELEYVLRLYSPGKKEIRSRRFGDVKTWDYRVGIRPKQVVSSVGEGLLLLPSVEKPEDVTDDDRTVVAVSSSSSDDRADANA